MHFVYFHAEMSLGKSETGVVRFAGVTHVGGDMLESIPAGDAIFMKVFNYFSENLISFLNYSL